MITKLLINQQFPTPNESDPPPKSKTKMIQHTIKAALHKNKKTKTYQGLIKWNGKDFIPAIIKRINESML